MTYKKWLVAAALVCAGGLWLMLERPAEETGRARGLAAPVSALTVESRAFRDEARALGTLRAWESVDVSASVSQIITELRFDDGQEVRRGDVLALLKQDAEQAALRELEANLKDAQRELQRLENLARQKQVAQTELDKARTLVQVTGHRMEEIEARIADRTIVAPFSGVLGLREVSLGALVSPGQRLTTLDDISRMRLEFTMPARLLGFLQPGRSVEALTPAFERVFSGRVTAVSSRVDPVARSIAARAEVDNAEQLLRPGMLMEVRVRGPEREAILVPEESLQSRAEQHFVWKLGDGEALRTEVSIGGRSPGWVEVVSGLAAGDRIVRDGVGRLRGARAPVRVVEG